MIHYTITKEAALREAQEGRRSLRECVAVADRDTYATWAWVGRELIRPCDLNEGGELRPLPRLPEQDHVLFDREAVELMREHLRRRNLLLDAQVSFPEKRRRWLVATCPEWREAVDHGTLSDLGVNAEVADCLLRVLRAKLAGIYDGSLEVLRLDAPVIDDHERITQMATHRELAKLAAMAKTCLSTIEGLALRTWEPEAVMCGGQVAARTVRVVLWCEAAASEVRARLVLGREE